ncbi:LysR family transcriptional regulator [Limnobaculum sp. M2-1]|uniref:LysR family transcriptional regulator n=1 Tax=Limnobaculum TaxID=2172100 RepID=UPI001C495B0B|nr:MULTISPECIES: LysR family transcriptional regulator [Limnobaculum]MBV7691440.1 LysR family transcriptional regulator [Limnobaculum sp. M2-1]
MTIITHSEDLTILIAVADSGGFSAAAEQLDIQVAKVSRAVARVEKQLNTTLFSRTTRRVELTEEGSQFIEKVRVGLEKLSEAEEWLKVRHEKPSGRLRIDSASPFILHQITPHIKDFSQRYPMIDIELSASDGIINLLEKRTDLAIRIGKLEDSTLHARVLGHSKLWLVASPGYLQLSGIPQTPEQLLSHRLLGFIPPSNLNHWSVGSGITITPDIAASNGEVLRQLCLEGNGIACLSNFMVQRDIEKGKLMVILAGQMQSPHPREVVRAVYYRNTALSSRIKLFIDFIEQRIVL